MHGPRSPALPWLLAGVVLLPVRSGRSGPGAPARPAASSPAAPRLPAGAPSGAPAGAHTAAAAGDTAAPRAPRLAMTDSGPVMELPPAMEAALRARVPGFRPWARESYDQETLTHAGPPERLALFGAAGDFDGDGTTDVVLSGHDEDTAYLIALLSEGDGSYAFHSIDERPLTPGQRRSRRLYLAAVAPGEVASRPELNEGRAPPEMKEAAFELIYEGAASALYVWDGSEFVVYTTGD